MRLETPDVYKRQYGFCMLLEGEPDTVYGIRRGSPLIAAKDETGSYVAVSYTHLMARRAGTAAAPAG